MPMVGVNSCSDAATRESFRTSLGTAWDPDRRRDIESAFFLGGVLLLSTSSWFLFSKLMFSVILDEGYLLKRSLMDEGYLPKRSLECHPVLCTLKIKKKKKRILPTQNNYYFAGIGYILKEWVTI